jgi:HEPN domain-containing protein
VEDNFDIEKTYNHWILTSERDFLTMINLYKSKDYSWALFVGHIVIERLLKACVVNKIHKHPPYTHDLTKLAKLTELDFSENYLDWLDTISTFNLNARYDSYKEAFYKKCTSEYTDEWVEKIKILKIWIKERL